MELADKPRLEEIRKKYGYKNSSYSFNTIYIWQSYFNNEVIIEDDAFYVKSNGHGDNCWFFPCGSETTIREFIDSHINEPDFILCNLDNDMVAFLNKNYEGKFDITRNPDEDMYILSIEDHMRLEGRAFRHLRNKINCFRKHGRKMVKVDDENYPIAEQLLTTWRENRKEEGMPLYDISEDIIMQQYKELEIDLFLIYVDDTVSGLIGGYPVWDDIIDVCLAKRISKDRGVNYGMENLFLAHYKDRYAYADIEEDLGIEDLRKSKRDFKPAYMLEMSTATSRLLEQGD